ncbi:MAG TPA: dipeptidase [Gaiellaceae bacterium]|jgi:acetylornithine deacetylase/succinyl-diaminopimelate desuccinylase-like protein|nr:dipeptidase [Gaiellaceae bacterium]
MSVDTIRSNVQRLMPKAKDELAELVAFQSVADAKQFPVEECDKASQWVIDAFAGVGFQDLAAHPTPDGSKAVVGHRPGPEGSPTVLLYCHYDVQPPLDETAWKTPVWELTEKDGRWYGRGAADCKGNIVMHLAALRALGDDIPCTVKLVSEGSEEQGTGGLEEFVPDNVDLLRADAILVCDAGNFAVGVPAVTTSLRGLANVVVTVETLGSAMHSGMFGGPAPDALAALIHMLATLRDEQGLTTVRGLDNTQSWAGVEYPAEQFRADATVLDGVDLIGGASVSDLLWARPVLTVLGIDVPPVVGSSAAIQPKSRARLNLRVPPGMDAKQAQDALVAHLEAVAPWNVKVSIEREAFGQPFTGSTTGPAYETLTGAMHDAYGRDSTTEGQGGSIPLCNVFREAYPDAEIMLLGVEEPKCLIHAPNESVDPSEIENMAVTEALFLQRYADAKGTS